MALPPLTPTGSEGAAFMKGQIKMKKYYIIREDGSSIFQLPYPKDFCIHCLCLLIEDGQKYRLMSFANSAPFPCQQLPGLDYSIAEGSESCLN